MRATNSQGLGRSRLREEVLGRSRPNEGKFKTSEQPTKLTCVRPKELRDNSLERPNMFLGRVRPNEIRKSAGLRPKGSAGLRPKAIGATQVEKCEGLSRQRLKGSVLVDVRLNGTDDKSIPSHDLVKSSNRPNESHRGKTEAWNLPPS